MAKYCQNMRRNIFWQYALQVFSLCQYLWIMEEPEPMLVWWPFYYCHTVVLWSVFLDVKAEPISIWQHCRLQQNSAVSDYGHIAWAGICCWHKWCTAWPQDRSAVEFSGRHTWRHCHIQFRCAEHVVGCAECFRRRQTVQFWSRASAVGTDRWVSSRQWINCDSRGQSVVGGSRWPIVKSQAFRSWCQCCHCRCRSTAGRGQCPPPNSDCSDEHQRPTTSLRCPTWRTHRLHLRQRLDAE